MGRTSCSPYPGKVEVRNRLPAPAECRLRKRGSTKDTKSTKCFLRALRVLRGKINFVFLDDSLVDRAQIHNK
jgi:hypothetical protein